MKEVSKAIKSLAKRHGIVLVAAARLPAGRQAAGSTGTTMTDLRASGAIEEHADSIILFDREDYYRARTIRRRMSVKSSWRRTETAEGADDSAFGSETPAVHGGQPIKSVHAWRDRSGREEVPAGAFD